MCLWDNFVSEITGRLFCYSDDPSEGTFLHEMSFFEDYSGQITANQRGYIII